MRGGTVGGVIKTREAVEVEEIRSGKVNQKSKEVFTLVPKPKWKYAEIPSEKSGSFIWGSFAKWDKFGPFVPIGGHEGDMRSFSTREDVTSRIRMEFVYSFEQSRVLIQRPEKG